MHCQTQVSVVIPCYNNAAHIGATLDSVLAQTLSPCEILVMDDGSTDASAEIIAGYPPPVRLIRLQHVNRATAMNRGFAEAKGELIGIVDGDDFWHPRFLECNAGALLSAERAVMAYCPAIVCGSDGTPTLRRDGRALDEPQVRNLLQQNHLCNSAVLVRTDVLRSVGGYEAAYWPCDDYHLWLKLAAQGRIIYQPEALAYYRVHQGQVTRNRARMYRQMLEVKLAFLRCHPEMAATLGPPAIRSTTRQWYIAACRAEYQRGNVQLAAEMSADCLRRYPWSLEAVGQWLLNRIPWRMRRLWVLPAAFDPHARRVLNP